MWSIFKKKEKNRASPPFLIRARYDAAQTTTENANHWAMADNLSANSANSLEVRATVRDRARYEAGNNCYARGMVNTVAGDMVGTGPRLQIVGESETFARELETQFSLWCEQINLAEKLRTMRMAKAVDGEAFAVIVQRSDGVLDLRPIECDRVTTPLERSLQSDGVDGMEVDRSGRVRRYYVLNEHPGDTNSFRKTDTYTTVAAKDMIHWFTPTRPEQLRGISELMPALPLFAQLRRYTLAVIAAAETAADFAAIITSDAPPNPDDKVQMDPMDAVPVFKRMMTVVPEGYNVTQLKAEQPATTYAEFKREILAEIGRCIHVPINVMTGDSHKHNYASGRLDFQTYHKMLRNDQQQCGRVVLDPILAAWSRMRGVVRPVDHYWYFDGFEHVDPMKEAKAIVSRVTSGVSNLAIECARLGRDWEDVMRQAAVEEKLRRKLFREQDKEDNIEKT